MLPARVVMMTFRAAAVLGVMVCVVSLGACGGAVDANDTPSGGAGGAPVKRSGVTSNAQVTQLPTADLGRVCDYMAKQLGGYNKQPSCTGMFVPTDVSRANCVKNVQGKTCKLTVSQVEDCADALHQARCSLPLVCAPLWACAES